jgi:hypothetical protein
MTSARFVTEKNSVDGPGFLSRNSTIPRDIGVLSAISVPQNNDTVFSFPSNGSVHSVFEDDPQTPRSENLERWQLLSHSSDMLSTNSQPSLTTESLEDSLDSGMYSISDSSDDMKLLDHQESIYPILNKILHHLLAGFRTATQNQSSPSESRGYSALVGSTNESAYTENTSRSGRKRKSQQDEDDGTGEDGSQPPPLKKLKSSEGEEPQKSFSCPYLKWNPIKYSSCCVKILSRISDVKQHLRRKHTPERYCQVCLATNFENEESLDAHHRTGPCSWRDPATLEGISYGQRQQLSKKSKHGTSEEEKWFMIWEILFSRDKRPTSVYIDTDLTLEMRQFQAYCERCGPVLMTEQIESDPAWLSLETTREQRAEYLERVIAQGLQILFNDWRENAPPSSITPERQSHDNTQDSRSKTSTSSLVDSGVMIGSSSSRDIGLQGKEILPVPRNPAMGITSQLSTVDTRARSPSPIQYGAATPAQIHIPNSPSNSFGPMINGQEQYSENQLDGINRELFEYLLDVGDIEYSADDYLN